MNRMFRWLLIGLFVISFSFTVTAQTNTNSPYSYFGLGIFEPPIGDRTSGMGGVGIGLKSEGFINIQNPASYAGIDSLFFILDLNVYGSSSYFKSKEDGYNSLVGNVNKISIGTRISRRLSAALGIVPYTNVGYKINSTKWIEGTNETFDILSKGNGGLNKIFLGTSFKIDKHNSVGVNTSVIFGSIDKSEEYTYPQINNSYWKRTEKYISKPNFCFDLGYQYSNTLNGKLKYTLGIVGGLKTRLNFSNYLSIKTDTTVIEKEELTKTYDFWIPAYMGFGASVGAEKWRAAVDYSFQNWSGVRQKNEMNYLADSYRFAAGVEYCPNMRLGKTLFQRITYQTGFHWDRTNLNLNNNNIDGYGVTFGVVVPIRNQYQPTTNLGVSFEVGRSGVYSNAFFRETYYKINLSLNMNDIWFMKRQYK